MSEACRTHTTELMKAEAEGKLEHAYWLETHFAEFFENQVLQIHLTGDEYEWVDHRPSEQMPAQAATKALPKLAKASGHERVENQAQSKRQQRGRTGSTHASKGSSTATAASMSASTEKKIEQGFQKVALGQNSSITSDDVVIFSSRNSVNGGNKPAAA